MKRLVDGVRERMGLCRLHDPRRVANNAEEQLKHASLQVDRLKERLEEIEAREAEWKRKAQESMRGAASGWQRQTEAVVRTGR